MNRLVALLVAVGGLASCSSSPNRPAAAATPPADQVSSEEGPTFAALLESTCLDCHEGSEDPRIPAFSVDRLPPEIAMTALVAVFDERMPPAGEVSLDERQRLVSGLCGAAGIASDVCAWRFASEQPTYLSRASTVVRRLDSTLEKKDDTLEVLSNELLLHNRVSRTEWSLDLTSALIAWSIAANECGDDEECVDRVLKMVLKEAL